MPGRVNVNVHVRVGGGDMGWHSCSFAARRTSRHPCQAAEGHSWEAGVFRAELGRGLTSLCCPRAAHGQHQRGRWPAGARGPGSDV